MVGERDGWGIPYNNKGGQVPGVGSRIEDRSTVKGGQVHGLGSRIEDRSTVKGGQDLGLGSR